MIKGFIFSDKAFIFTGIAQSYGNKTVLRNVGYFPVLMLVGSWSNIVSHVVREALIINHVYYRH